MNDLQIFSRRFVIRIDFQSLKTDLLGFIQSAELSQNKAQVVVAGQVVRTKIDDFLESLGGLRVILSPHKCDPILDFRLEVVRLETGHCAKFFSSLGRQAVLD